MNQTEKNSLPGTGERFLPEFEGDIVTEHFHRYLLASQYVSGKEVLDIASGEGYGSALLAETAKSVVGVDIDQKAVRFASDKYRADNLEYRHGDCAAIPLTDASVDIVVSFETLEHHDRHDEMMAEIKRVLRPGGVLIISSPDKREYSDVPGYTNPYHVRELYRDEFEALLERHFTCYTLLGQRVIYGSAILGVDSSARIAGTYNADNATLTPGLSHPMYWIALASDGELPQPDNSIYPQAIERSNEVLQRDRQLGEYRQEAEQQLAALQERDSRISIMQHSLDEQAEAIEVRDTQINRLQDHLAEQADSIETRDTRLNDLEKGLAAAEAEKAALTYQEESHRRLYNELFYLQSRTQSVSWLIKRAIRRLFQLPSEYRRERHERYLITQSGLFDADWYLENNPDVQSRGLDALKHYQRHGGYEGRAASPAFDTASYLRQHPGLIGQRQHPLLHYLQQNQAQSGDNPSNPGDDRLFAQLFQGASQASDDYVGLSDHHLEDASRVRAIAFYLPQFHPIAENDRWWGKGFTEWTNVSKAVPQFVGHYQPRLPGELGFYDLRLPQVQERQVELARQHGIEAFCFHYYWFSGRKRLLETPIQQYVDNPNIDFPFCICWANENWTRRWDGQENDVLMAQRHEPHDDLEFIEDLAPLLKDSRYLRVDGKPLLIVYRVDILPDAAKTAETWRQYCREQGIGELHLVAAQSFGIGDPAPYGFDAGVEFPPHGLHARQMESELEFINPEFSGRVYDYLDVVNTQLAKPIPDYRLYRTVFPAWDNEARKPGRGHVFHRASPAAYRRWLADACQHADSYAGDGQLVFINAWNEWAEGAYLEPDRRYGYAYLQATQQVLAQFPAKQITDYPSDIAALGDKPRHNDTAVILHLYYFDLWEEIAPYLANLQGNYDLFVTLSSNVTDEQAERLERDVPGVRLARVPNRGRDIAPFLEVLRSIMPLGYREVCKVHAKRSVHRGDGDDWRREMLDSLLGSVEKVSAIQRAFEQRPDLGLVGPAGHWLAYSRYWGIHPESPARVERLLESLGDKASLDDMHFFAGSMFWCRPEALAPLLEIVEWNDFEAELGQTDGALGHVLERIIPRACQLAGYEVADTEGAGKAGQAPKPRKHYAYAAPCPAPEQIVDPQAPARWPHTKAKLRQLARKSALARRLRREILHRIG